MERKNRYFLKQGYYGSDNRDFQKDFVAYLKEVIESTRWESMNEGQLFLQGGKQALEEIIEELKQDEDEEI